MQSFPILNFHSIASPPASARTPSLYLSRRRLHAYLGTLATLGFRGVSMGEAARLLLDVGRPTNRPEKLVVLTFDDGYADNVVDALPVLREHGFTATCYVTSRYLGSFNEWDADVLGVRTPMMTRRQLVAWHAAGMEVGAHTRSHVDLTTCSTSDQLRDEVLGSKTDLEEITGAPVAHFSYPFGRYDAAAVAAVRAAGFSTATTVRDRRVRSTDDRFELPRLYVGGTYLLPLMLARWLTRAGDWTVGADPPAAK
jgi:peptidoglycan/xylan/chitin deacetylase (PgdA/CDA1 family)